MEYPDREIEGVIKSLTTGGPSELQSTLDEYFVEDASFIHPYCYVPPFTRGFLPLARNLSSSWLVLGIYRWYKILSPTIDISIDSTAFDEKSGLLYVSIRQVFAVWFVPFYRAPVKLVTVLKLRSRSSAVGKKYIIESQEDLYQMNDCIQFLCPGLGPAIWTVWQVVSTVICVLLSLLFLPVYYLLNKDKRN